MSPGEIIATWHGGLLVPTEGLKIKHASDTSLKTFQVEKGETIGARMRALVMTNGLFNSCWSR